MQVTQTIKEHARVIQYVSTSDGRTLRRITRKQALLPGQPATYWERLHANGHWIVCDKTGVELEAEFFANELPNV